VLKKRLWLRHPNHNSTVLSLLAGLQVFTAVTIGSTSFEVRRVIETSIQRDANSTEFGLLFWRRRWRPYQSQSHFTADIQSVSMSWCRARFGTFDYILLPVQELRSGSSCPIFVGRLLRREAGSVLCKSQSVVICLYVHYLLFTFLMCFTHFIPYIHTIQNIQYIQGLFQSRLGTAYYAPVTSSSGTTTAV
jgi:hypothetical protein